MKTFVVGVFLFLGISSVPAGIVFGCFDNARAGVASPDSGSVMNDFRAHVLTNFPGASFKSTNTLTSSFLAGVDVVVLLAAFDSTIPITPLSAAEQSALLDFVRSGGGALILTDNNIQFEAASDSLSQPFNLNATGVISGSANATVTNLTHPIAAGPFGTVTSFFIQSFPGWYASLGTNAQGIATLNDNGQSALAAIPPHKLLPGSGGVVFFSDSTINDGNYVGSVITLVDNAIAYIAPKSTWLPTLFIRSENASVIVSWETNHAGFRLQASTNLPATVWNDVTLTGINEAQVSPTNNARFFRLIKP
jgi:hypothetical protein